MLDTVMKTLTELRNLIELLGVGVAGAGAAGSVSAYQELVKKGLKFKSAAPMEYSWVAVKDGKEVDKGYMKALDLRDAKKSAIKSGTVIGADQMKVLGMDGKVLSTIDLRKERMEQIGESSLGSIVVGRPLQPTDNIVGCYALIGLTKDGTVDVILSKSKDIIGTEHYKFRAGNYQRIGRTEKLPKKFNGTDLNYNSLKDFITRQFQPKRFGTITLK